MKTDNTPLSEIHNTDIATLNETLITYYLSNEKWTDSTAKDRYYSKHNKISKKELDAIHTKSKNMAIMFMNQTDKNIKKSWWTPTEKILSEKINRPIKDNPSDVLVQFDDGTYLGLSAKHCKDNYKKIPFKNLALKTVDTFFDGSMLEYSKDYIKECVSQYNLPASLKERKQYIRNNPTLNALTRQEGEIIREKINLDFYEILCNTDISVVEQFLKTKVINVTTDLKYLKLTCHNKGVKIEDPFIYTKPFENLKFHIPEKSKYSVTFTNQESYILNFRWKWNTEPLCGTIKASAV
jgi:hypothetical protein